MELAIRRTKQGHRATRSAALFKKKKEIANMLHSHMSSSSDVTFDQVKAEPTGIHVCASANHLGSSKVLTTMSDVSCLHLCFSATQET